MDELTIALELYDRHLPFFLGTVKPPDGMTLRALEVGMVPPRRHGISRHARFLKGEFDIAEHSLASYIIGVERGLPFGAVPVFPRRLFSQNHIFVNTNAGIRNPSDLIGRRVGVGAFQITMAVLAKGDLKTEYGVPWDQIHWVTTRAEEIPVDYGMHLERAKGPIDELLFNGQIDALIYPHPPPRVLERDPRVRRLFADARGESTRYYRRHGWYPIMHLLAFKRELAERKPDLPRALIGMWEEAKRQTREYYDDPGYALLAFSRTEYEAQRDTLAPELWPSGIKANRANLEHFMAYCVDQRLIKAPVPIERLFHESVLDT
ncbi:MAG: taurine ABC transporter substrate-binding protein [Betaproteobacteria bacterium]|nr:taurine ABC transporter substrate-binding protein [Betaproteobacteria bacterium]